MLVEPKSRYFQQYDFCVRTARNQGVPLSFQKAGKELDVLSLLQHAIGRDASKLLLGKADECKITKVELSADKSVAAILFRRSSPDASTPIFDQRKTGRLRKAERAADEDLAISAHLFVDMKPDPKRPHRYRAVLEEVPSIGRSYISSIIDRILRQAEYTYEPTPGEEKTTFSKCMLEGYKSSSLASALKKGSIPYVELVRTPALHGLDEAAFTPKEQRQKILIKSNESLVDKVQTLKAWAVGQGWNEMRVQIRMPEGRSRLVSISREDDAASVLFVRAEQVYVERDLDVCCENVDSQLFGRALEMFAKEWSAN